MTTPTARQLEMLRLIANGWRAYRPMTVRELGDAMGIRSTNGVNDHLDCLRRKGLLGAEENKARLLVPTDRGWRLVGGKPWTKRRGTSEHLRSRGGKA